MDVREIRAAMKLCTQDHAPNCKAACPLHVDVRELWRLLKTDNFDQGLRIYARTVFFPRLVGAFCPAPCEQQCARNQVDEAISIRGLEESLSRYGSAPPISLRPFMSLKKRAAIVGGGISGLAAALHLYEKGFQIDIFEAESRLGGRGWLLSEALAAEDFAFLAQIPWQIHYQTVVDEALLQDIISRYDAVYLSGDSDLAGKYTWNKNTQQSLEQLSLFGGGQALGSGESYSIIDSLCGGRIAAISMDRYLKAVSLTAGRSHEGSYTTQLPTYIDPNTKPGPRITPSLGRAFTRQEARQEAARCLDCQCLRCVKQCVYMREFEGYPQSLMQEMATHVSMILGQRQSGPLINSCSLCGLCQELCPNATPMPEAALSARQILVNKAENVAAVHDFPLRDMDFSNSEAYSLWHHEPGEDSSEYLFFPGCQLGAVLPELLPLTYDYLRSKLPKVGLGLGCCGAPAHWSGYEQLYQEGVSAIIRRWQELGKPTFIAACPTCSRHLQDACPEMTIISLWQVFAEKGLPETVAHRPQLTVALQDACGSRHDPETHHYVRQLLREMGCSVEELAFSRQHSKCCNYGGLMAYANPDLAARALEERLAESSLDYVVYCGACREQCQRGGKNTHHLLELLLGREEPPVTDISHKRRNRVAVREDFCRKYWPEEKNLPEAEPMSLIIPEQVRNIIDSRLILEEDVWQVIKAAETSGRRLKKPNGHYLAHLQPGIITYWVEYELIEEGYLLHNAYSHRLQIVDD